MAFTWNGPAIVAEVELLGHETLLVVADRILDRAQADCPVDTGELKASGEVIPDPGDQAVYVVFSADHAQPVHNGTVRMQARPFLARAALYEQEAAVQAMRLAFGSR